MKFTVDKLIEELQNLKDNNYINGNDLVFVETLGNFGDVISDNAVDIYIETNVNNQKLCVITGEI